MLSQRRKRAEILLHSFLSITISYWANPLLL
ncbi:hypothetical protein ABH897_004060 [Paenibacillus sp. RC73]